jgi:hypothetical protein
MVATIYKWILVDLNKCNNNTLIWCRCLRNNKWATCKIWCKCHSSQLPLFNNSKILKCPNKTWMLTKHNYNIEWTTCKVKHNKTNIISSIRCHKLTMDILMAFKTTTMCKKMKVISILICQRILNNSFKRILNRKLELRNRRSIPRNQKQKQNQ